MTFQPDIAAIHDAVYRRSLADPTGFWGPIAEKFHWHRKFDRVLEGSDPVFARWFPGGLTNLCFNAIDRHLKNGLEKKPAITWVGAGQGITINVTYGNLYRETNRFAGVLRSLRVGKGDRVFLFMPTVPETIAAMLACARIGALHVGVFTGYGLEAIAKRIKKAAPKVAITADGSFRRNRAVPLKDTLDAAMAIAPIEKVIVLNRGICPMTMKPGRDMDWSELMEAKGTEYVEPLPVESDHPSHVVFTSGDTGNPRGVVMDTGGFMVGLASSLPMIYGTKPDDVFWATSDIGWRLGHNYICYGPLFNGLTTIMFEGTPDYPDHEIYYRTIQQHRVSVIFTVPTIFKMLQRFGIDHAKKYDLSSIRHLFIAGEYCDPETWRWTTEVIGGKPVIDHYWLTEAAWPMTSVMMGVGLIPLKPGYAGKPCVGWNLDIVDRNGDRVEAEEKGILVARPPLPPGNVITLLNDNDFYVQEYWRQFPGKTLYLCGDIVKRDEDGYIAIISRVDEVINVAAMRVSTREIAAAIGAHPSVAEVCVIGAYDALKGEEPVAFIVLKPGFQATSQVKLEMRALVRDKVGAVAAPREIRFVTSLPKDRNGRHLRAVIKAVYDGAEITDEMTAAIDASPEEISAAVEELKRALA